MCTRTAIYQDGRVIQAALWGNWGGAVGLMAKLDMALKESVEILA
jgi:hypothetical protein